MSKKRTWCENCYWRVGKFTDKVSLKPVCYECMMSAIEKRIRFISDFKLIGGK